MPETMTIRRDFKRGLQHPLPSPIYRSIISIVTFKPTGAFDVTPLGGQVREGESFSYGDFGDLTGVTGVTIDGVACTSVVVAGDNLSLTAVAPTDGVRYDTLVAIRTT